MGACVDASPITDDPTTVVFAVSEHFLVNTTVLKYLFRETNQFKKHKTSTSIDL